MKFWKDRIKCWNASQVTAILFLIYIFATGLAALPRLMVNVGNSMLEGTDLGSFIRMIDDQYNDMLSLEKEIPVPHNKGSYINLNGKMARLLQQPEMNGRVLLKNGLLAGTNDTPPLTEEIAFSAENITRFSQAQTALGRHFLFVMTPGKIDPQGTSLPTGYTDTTNASADILLQQLTENGVTCLDLRLSMAAEGITWEEAFYITDHHWTPETGFWAYDQVLKQLQTMGAIDAVDSFYTSMDNYEFRTYPNTSLGSDGKRTGIYFAGLDDSTFIIPKYENSIRLELPQHGIVHEGAYENVSYYTGYHEDFNDPDYFNYSMYGVYGWGNNPITLWRNAGAPENRKCMLIGDSFGNVPFSLMSLYFTSCDELDMRFYDGDFQEHFQEYAPDIVVLMFNPDHTTFENADYPYFPCSP